MITSRVSKWDEVDVHDLAEIAYLSLQASASSRREGLTIEGMENWLRRLEFDLAPVVIQAFSADKAIGWLLLFLHDDKRGEINPWALNGHPLIIPGTQRKQITVKLLERAISFGKQQGLSRIELAFQRSSGDYGKSIDKNKNLYESLGFKFVTETAIMRMSLSSLDFRDNQIPSQYTISPLIETDYDELYKCYFETFRTGQDRFFFDQNDDEKLAYFESIFDKSEPLNREASLVLLENNQIIGFSLVRPTHGEGNVHLWMFGIHPGYRRRGLGKATLRYIIWKSKEQGFRTMSLGCEPTNQPAYKLYISHGFREEFRKMEFTWKSK
ncbi:MAG: GNAT family N-acetyltransferase [Promethearchaeota archaeon]